MPSKDTLKRDILATKILETLVTTYEEIAVMRIQKIRKKVVSTRSFYEGLGQIYSNVQASHTDKVTKILKNQDTKLKKDHKKGVVLISTNKYLSGSITSNVLKDFVKFIDANPHEIIVTGHIGRDRLSQIRPKAKVSYFDLPDRLTNENLQELVTHLQQYDELIIFHGQFLNLVKQLPLQMDLTGTMADEELKKFKQENINMDYFLFEPSLDDVVNFFNTTIFAMLFKQMTHEARLAQLGSRITSMEKASHNIDKRLTNLTLQRQQIVRAEANSKQRQRLAGISIWS